MVPLLSIDFGDLKRFPHPPLRPEGLVFIHEVQGLRQQQQSDKGQFQVRPLSRKTSPQHPRKAGSESTNMANL